jgi:hypothetical protein
VLFLILLKDIVEKKHHTIVSTLYISFYQTTVAIFCIYIEFISKNAIEYLHFINAISILCSVIIFTMGVDSPLRCLDNGDTNEAKKSL